MRARYTAYIKVEVDFLLGSLHPDGSRAGVDRESTEGVGRRTPTGTASRS